MTLNYLMIKIISINNLLHFLLFHFLGPILSVKDKSAWQEITSSWQFLALCLSLIFTSGLIWYSEKKYTERLLAEQEEENKKQNAAQQNNEPNMNNLEENSALQNTISSTVDQSVSTPLTFTDIMVELAFWGIIISSILLIIFVCWLSYGLFLKFEKRWNAYFADLKKNYTRKKPW